MVGPNSDCKKFGLDAYSFSAERSSKGDTEMNDKTIKSYYGRLLKPLKRKVILYFALAWTMLLIVLPIAVVCFVINIVADLISRIAGICLEFIQYLQTLPTNRLKENIRKQIRKELLK